MLDPAIQSDVLRLFFADKISRRHIASQLKIHRQSVSAILARNTVLLNRQSSNTHISILAPFHDHIEELLKKDTGRSAVNILQEIRNHGYRGGLTVLKDHLRVCRPIPAPKAYLSLEFISGQTAQVDWGDFGDPFGLGRKLWCFVMVMCYSRLLYVEFTLSACFESFIRCHENAFNFFGGVPKEIWFDNLATAVAERKQKIIRFNPKFLAYAGHNHFKPVACNLGAGNEKGRVEDGVRYVRYNFWPGRSFNGFCDVNPQLSSWCNEFANKRTHAVTRKVPELHFLQEKPHLLPLHEPYDTDEIRNCKLPKNFRIHFDANEYSAPWRLVGRTLTVRGDENTVRIYLKNKRVTCHKRSWQKNQVIENPKHKEGLLEQKPGAQNTSDIEALKALGPNGEKYLQFLGAQHRSINSELKNMMVLITVYGPKALEECIGSALEIGVIGTDHLERILERSEDPFLTKPAPLQLSDERLRIAPHIPNLKSYDALLFDSQESNDHNTRETQ